MSAATLDRIDLSREMDPHLLRYMLQTAVNKLGWSGTITLEYNGCGCGGTGARIWYDEPSEPERNFEVLPATPDCLHEHRSCSTPSHFHECTPCKSIRFEGDNTRLHELHELLRQPDVKPNITHPFPALAR